MSSAPSGSDHGFRSVGVLGLGAMGGSFARAMSGAGSASIAGWSPDPAERAMALDSGAVGSAPDDWRPVVRGADLVVLAAPLNATCALIGDLASEVRGGAVLTDVASLKAPVEAAAREADLSDRWVGSHPMCGTAASGFAASRAELFEGARVWIVEGQGAEDPTLRVEALWRALGAKPERTDAPSHDRLMALASALPQMTANALALTLADAQVAPSQLGPGGTDMTRLAESSPSMWSDILSAESSEVAEALRTLAERSAELAEAIEAGDIGRITLLMERTRAWKLGS